MDFPALTITPLRIGVLLTSKRQITHRQHNLTILNNHLLLPSVLMGVAGLPAFVVVHLGGQDAHQQLTDTSFQLQAQQPVFHRKPTRTVD